MPSILKYASIAAAVASTAQCVPETLYSANPAARLWRTTLLGPPKNDASASSFPQYTFSQGNTPKSPSAKDGTYPLFTPSKWTSGFFPNALWKILEQDKLCPGLLAKDKGSDGQPSAAEWEDTASKWNDGLASNVHYTDTHDIGFLSAPFESALQLTGNQSYVEALSTMSYNLAARFVPKVGCTRSWNTPGSHDDSVLVIIDNMMNLGLLLRSATEYTKNSTLMDMAKSHANKTMQHHVRPDGSTYHVCDYSGTTGELYLCRTAQGLADDSTWARGQAWAIYGFAQMYNYTGDAAYLETSQRTADWYLAHLPADGVPFWDFNAPQEPDSTPRDVSSAMVASSGLLLLSTLDPSKPAPNKYSDAAIKLLDDSFRLAQAAPIGWAEAGKRPTGAKTSITTKANTTSPAESDTRQFEAMLLHSTVNNNPNTTEKNYDTGLIYADYFALEAANRLLKMGLADCPSYST